MATKRRQHYDFLFRWQPNESLPRLEPCSKDHDSRSGKATRVRSLKTLKNMIADEALLRAEQWTEMAHKAESIRSIDDIPIEWMRDLQHGSPCQDKFRQASNGEI